MAVVIGVCSRSRVTGAVPIVVLASCNMIGQVAAIADGKMQGVRAGATIVVSICVGVSSSVGVCDPMPSIAVTSGIRVAVVCALENGQIQRVHIVAAGTGLVVVIGLCSRSRVIGAVPIVALASCNMIGHVAVVANSKVQRVGAWAAVVVGISIGVCSGGVIRSSMPSITFTCIVVVTVMRSIVNGQIKLYKSVAAMLISGQEGGGGGAGVKCAAMPSCAVTSCDEFCYSISRVDC